MKSWTLETQEEVADKKTNIFDCNCLGDKEKS